MYTFCQALFYGLPYVFIWSFNWVYRWKYLKKYLLANLLFPVCYGLLIAYMTRNNLDGWGVAIFGMIALYSHFIIAIAFALFVKFSYLKTRCF